MNSDTVWHTHAITKIERRKRSGCRPAILWFTGLSGSGKSTIANALEKVLFEKGIATYLLDGDNIRQGLNSDLGFDSHDRQENIRRIGEVAKMFVDAGLFALAAFISPYREDRDKVRHLVGKDEFIEVYIDTPIEVCERRDPKGLYHKARLGKIEHFTGIDAPYEAPLRPEIHIRADRLDIAECVEEIVTYLEKKGHFNAETH